MSFLVDFMPMEIVYIFTAIMIVLGILWCYFGFKFYKALVGLNGFVFGVIFLSEILTYIYQAFNLDSSGKLTFIFVTIACLALGVVFAVLAVRFNALGLFLIGALAGYFASAFLTELNGLTCIIISVVVGLLMGFFGKFLIIFISAILGGISLAESCTRLASPLFTGMGRDMLLWILAAIFIITGIIVQMKARSKQKLK